MALVIITQRHHEEGRLAAGQLWRPESELGRAVCAVAGIVGAAGAILIWVLTDETSSFPYSGGFFLIGLCTASVILAAVGAPRSVVPRFLSLTPVRYVGRISYGIYIWHWPLFLWINHQRTGLDGYPLFALRVLVTLIVAALSFHLVERPIRMGTFLRQWRAWVAVPVAVVVVVAALIAATVDTSALASTTYPGSSGPPASAAAGHGATTTTVASAASAGPPVRVLLFGDSVALTLGVGLSVPSVEDTYHYQLSDHGILGCGVVDGPAVELLGAVDETPPACNGTPLTPGEPAASQPWQDQWLNSDVGRCSPTWSSYWPAAGRWWTASTRASWTNILHPAFAAYVKSQLELASKLVTTAGANIVFLTAPCTNEGEQPDGAPWPEDNPARLAEYNKLLRQVAALHPKTDSVVDLNAAACPGGKFTPSLDGVAVPDATTASTSPTRAASSWPRTSCRRSWRPAGPRWRASHDHHHHHGTAPTASGSSAGG